jgi:hypothetical protein
MHGATLIQPRKSIETWFLDGVETKSPHYCRVYENNSHKPK